VGLLGAFQGVESWGCKAGLHVLHCLFIYPSSIHPSAHLSTHSSTHPPVRLSIHPSSHHSMNAPERPGAGHVLRDVAGTDVSPRRPPSFSIPDIYKAPAVCQVLFWEPLLDSQSDVGQFLTVQINQAVLWCGVD
jgi:hypothetical protein